MEILTNAGSAKLMYSPKEVCELTGIDLNKMRRMCAAGEVPAVKVGARWFIPAAKFDEWLEGKMGGR